MDYSQKQYGGKFHQQSQECQAFLRSRQPEKLKNQDFNFKKYIIGTSPNLTL